MSIEKGTKLRNDLKELVMESPMDEVKYFADIILPPIMVEQTSAAIPVLSTSAGMKNLDLKKAGRGSFQRGEWVWGKDSFVTAQYGYEEAIDNVEALENSDFFDEELVATQIAYSQVKLAREKRVADAVFNSTTFNAGNDVQAAAALWSVVANADPFLDIDNAYAKFKIKAGRAKNILSLAITEDAFRAVMKATKLMENIKYTQDIETKDAAVKAQFLADFLGIKEVIVITSIADTTPIGVEDAVFGNIWNKTNGMLFMKSPSVNSWKVPGLGRQPKWSKFSKDILVESYNEDTTDSRVVRVREYSGEKVNSTFGVRLTGLLA
jgi:hypothetical protein